MDRERIKRGEKIIAEILARKAATAETPPENPGGNTAEDGQGNAAGPSGAEQQEQAPEIWYGHRRTLTDSEGDSDTGDEQERLPQQSHDEPQSVSTDEEEEAPPGDEENADNDRLPQDERDETLEERFARLDHLDMLYGPDRGAPKAVWQRRFVVGHNCGEYGHLRRQCVNPKRRFCRTCQQDHVWMGPQWRWRCPFGEKAWHKKRVLEDRARRWGY